MENPFGEVDAIQDFKCVSGPANAVVSFQLPPLGPIVSNYPEMTADEVASIHNASETDKKIKESGPENFDNDRDLDAEEKHSNGESHQLPELQRRLKSRHLQMIAMVGALIAYIFVGSIVYSVMTALGEVATYLPIPGAFATYANRIVDPSLGFAMGWIYWFSWASTFALELTATGLIIQFWDDQIPMAIFIAIFWVVIIIINMFPVSFYGEAEFWLSSIKIITVVGFMIFAICMNAGVGKEGYIGFRYWIHPGPFIPYLLDNPHQDALAKFVGFWAILIKAGFSYQGTELVGIAAGETANPRKNVPSAIRKTFFRIVFFFIFTVFFVGIVVPSDDKRLTSDSSGADANASPFVIAARRAGVNALPSIINAVLLTVVLSAANSNVYSGSRILVGLANESFAPRIFAKTTKGGVPYASVAFTGLFGLLGFLNLSNAGATVFNWLMQIAGLAGFITWASLNIIHLGFMRALKARGISRDTLPYKGTWQPYFSWYGLFFNILIILTQGFTAFVPKFSVTTFFINYLSLILFAVLYIGHKIAFRTEFVKPIDANIETGRCED
ncbi:hypothetical protein N7541_000411 [Penicillium brevicompactum]|uniref:Amino acid permease/ SLC12A domain-containing protein n=1 Tax=Penicillium brevicompactum TaxID=5074 RepID=A0A9W9RU88_PENBR|nr:hypothetical protein N7541_000411 [Penicillium brevicompactum]